MPTGVFDASLITQRARAKAESNSFINRIQNPTNPTTSYGPLTGIYDNSEVNRVTNGQMKYFQRNGACTVAYIGCPCTVTVNGQVVNNVVAVAPGAVTNLRVEYGSTVVYWDPPTFGTSPFTYELRATSTTPGAITPVIRTNVTSPVTLAVTDLTPGVNYTFQVIPSGPGGTSTATPPTTTEYAPYDKPTYTGNTPTSTLTQSGITISYNSYTAFSRTTGTLYNSAGTSIGTGVATATTFTIISGLSPETTYTDCYFRLTAGNDTSSNSNTFSFTTVPYKVGPVPSITSVYGTDTNGVDVTWTAPTTGGTPTSYTITATPSSGSTVTASVPYPELNYSFAVSALASGTLYTITVIGVNSAGIGTAYSGTPSTIYAPYGAPVVSAISSSSFDPGLIYINIDYLSIFPTFPSTLSYIVKQYVNNSTSSTTLTGSYNQNNTIGGQITLGPSGLSTNNVYAFQVQLWNGNTYTSFTVKSDPPTPVYPNGPQGISVDNITSTTVQIIYTDYIISGGFDLTTGGATAIITDGTTTYDYTNLTNTSVIISGTTELTPLTEYTNLTIKFLKTIQGTLIDSAASTVTTFRTNGIAPTGIIVTTPNPSATSNIAGSARITFNPYNSSNPGEFDPSEAVVYITGNTQAQIESYDIASNTIDIRNLSTATTYNNFQILLKNTNTNPSDISDRSATFTVITKADGPSNLSFVSSTYSSGFSDLILSFTKPSDIGTLTSATAIWDSGTFSSVSIYSQTEVRLSGLPPSTTYNNIYITVSDGTYTSIDSTVLDSATTAAEPDPVPDAPESITIGTPSYSSQPITWGNSYSYTLTQALISGSFGYTNLTQSGLTITGLAPNTYYSGLTVQVGTTGGLSNSGNIPDFTTDSLPNPDVTGYTGTYVPGSPDTTTISISYNTYPVTPVAGTLHQSNGNEIGTDNSPSTTGLTITGLTPGIYYPNCYITLRYSGSQSPSSNAFNVTTTPVINAIQNPSYGPNPITITFTAIGAANINGGTLYVPDPYGAYSGSNITSNSIQFSPSFIDQIADCYIILSDNGNPTLPSNTFTVDTRYPPPQNIGITTFMNAVTISFTYSAFNPNSGILTVETPAGSFSGSINGSSPNYELYVSGLDPNTSYDNCYIQISDGFNTSQASSTFSFITNT